MSIFLCLSRFGTSPFTVLVNHKVTVLASIHRFLPMFLNLGELVQYYELLLRNVSNAAIILDSLSTYPPCS